MKNIMKNEKGAITLFVLVSMLFMTMFLITIYTLSTNNEIATRNAAKNLKDKYEVGLDRIDEIYVELLDENSKAKAYDQYGNEIENFSKNWDYENLNNRGWNIKYKGTINESGKITGEVPYYIRVGNNEKYVISYAHMFDNINKDNITKLDLSNFKTDKIESMGYMFCNFTKLKTLNITSFITDNVNSMGGMFEGCSSIEKIDVGKFNTSKVKDMWYMFARCTMLRELNISQFDTSSVTSMASMFSGCTNLGWIDTNENGEIDEEDERPILDVSGFNTSAVTNMTDMFNGCKRLTYIKGLGYNDSNYNFNTANVTSMKSMFGDCYDLEELNVSKFDTNKVVDMRGMFNNCRKIKTLDVSGFNTPKLERMNGMFNYCSSLTNIDVSGFDSSRITDFIYLFNNCEELREIKFNKEDGSNYFNTSTAENFAYMFNGCKNLEILDVSKFDTTNAETMERMFNGCEKIAKIKGLTTEELNSNFKTNKVKSMSRMFCGCSELKEINISNFSTESLLDYETELSGNAYNDKVAYTYQMFYGLRSIENITLPEKFIIKAKDITIYKGYNSEEDRESGTPTNLNIIGDMFAQGAMLKNVYVSDEATRTILQNNYSVVRSK